MHGVIICAAALTLAANFQTHGLGGISASSEPRSLLWWPAQSVHAQGACGSGSLTSTVFDAPGAGTGMLQGTMGTSIPPRQISRRHPTRGLDAMKLQVTQSGNDFDSAGAVKTLESDEWIGCGRYPLRVRMRYFFACSPTSFTLIERQR